MKKVLTIISCVAVTTTILAFTILKNPPDSDIIDRSVQTSETSKKDTVKLYYGLKAEEITNLPNENIKSFCELNDITYGQFFIAKKQANIELLDRKITIDSTKLHDIYLEIEKSLGIE